MNLRVVKEQLERLLNEDNMSGWEQDFAGSIIEQLDDDKGLSQKQESKISQIFSKYE